MRLRMGGLRARQTGTAKASLRRDLPGEERHQDRAQALPLSAEHRGRQSRPLMRPVGVGLAGASSACAVAAWSPRSTTAITSY